MAHWNVLGMSGGGARGAVQLGMLLHLIGDREMAFDLCAGVSVGALNGAVLMQGEPSGQLERLEELATLYRGIDGPDDIYRRRGLSLLRDKWMFDVFNLPFRDAAYGTRPLRRLLEASVDPDALDDRLRVGVASLQSGEWRTVPGDDPRILDWVMASAAMSGYFPPVEIEGQLWVDGGVRHITPLWAALEMLRERRGEGDTATVYVLMASPLGIPAKDQRRYTGLENLMRGVEIMLNEIYLGDMRRGRHAAAEAGIEVVPIAPREDALGVLAFEPMALERGKTVGYQQAKEAMAARG